MLIELKKVSFIYQKGTPLAQEALKDISLTVKEGEFLGLIGPIGSGKSTLIQHFNGLLAPTEGEVLIEGKKVGVEVKPADVRKKVGLVFQFPEAQLFEETVFSDVAFGPRNLGLSLEDIEGRVRRALELVGFDFEAFKPRSPFSLSGGEMRRVAVAGVLAMGPKILVLDEPTSGLDEPGKTELLSYLQRLHRKKGTTIVLVSQDMDEVARLASRIIVLDKGRVVMEGSPKEIFAQAERLKEMGLGVPQTTALLQAFKRKGLDVATDLFEVEEVGEAILAALEKSK